MTTMAAKSSAEKLKHESSDKPPPGGESSGPLVVVPSSPGMTFAPSEQDGTGQPSGQRSKLALRKARQKANRRAKKLAESSPGDAQPGEDAPPTTQEQPQQLSPEQRREHVQTLLDEDRAELANEWELAPDSDTLTLVLASDERYAFYRSLSADERAAISHTQIRKKKRPTAEVIASVKKQRAQQERQAREAARRERIKTLATLCGDPPGEPSAEDLDYLAKQWKLSRDAPQFKAALASEKAFALVWSLPAEIRTIVARNRIKKGTPLTETEIAEARAKKKQIEEEEAERQQREEEQRVEAERVRVDVAGWGDRAAELRARIADRIAKEIPDFVWEDEFDKGVVTGRKKIEGGAKLATVVKGTSKHWDSTLDEAKRKKDIGESAKKFDKLSKSALDRIKNEALADTGCSCAAFEASAAEALRAQRNPDKIEKWVSWMRLTMYPKYRKLTDRADLGVHFTVGWNSISMPATVGDATTAEQLVASLFRAPSGDKMDEAHVSLETQITDSEGRPKNPHKYWLDGPTDYELRFDGGDEIRWDPGKHNEGEIATALDDAMGEIKAILLARAQVILDANGIVI